MKRTLAVVLAIIIAFCAFDLAYAEDGDAAFLRYLDECASLNEYIGGNMRLFSAQHDEFELMRVLVRFYDSPSDPYEWGAVKVAAHPDGKFFVMQYDSTDAARAACETLNSLDCVEYAEPDAVIYLENTEASLFANGADVYSWGVESIGADKYKAYLAENGYDKEITVGIVDAGVETTHEYIADRIVEGTDTHTSSSASWRYGYDVTEGNFHATAVSGCIAQATNDNVKIMPLKAFGFDTGSSSSVANAVEYGRRKGVDILNMSLGGLHNSSNTAFKTVETQINSAIKAGIIVIAAAGNDGKDASDTCPAHMDSVITVGSVSRGMGLNYLLYYPDYSWMLEHGKTRTEYAAEFYDKNNVVASSFSNYGSAVDFCAPGGEIYTSVLSGGYDYAEGTSFSSPLTCAAAALLMSDGSTYAQSEMENLLKSSVITPSGWDSAKYGSGFLHLYDPYADDFEIEVIENAFSIEDGALGGTIRVQVKNMHYDSRRGDVIFAFYDDRGALVKVKRASGFSVSARSSKTVSCGAANVSADARGMTVMATVWDGFLPDPKAVAVRAVIEGEDIPIE